MATLLNRPGVRKPRKVSKPTGTCGLTLSLNGTRYHLTPLPVQPGTGCRRIWRLTKSDGEVYDVAEHRNGRLECTCASFIFDHDGHPEHPHCKHMASLLSLGLIESRREAVDEWAGTDSWVWALGPESGHSADAEWANRQAEFRAAVETHEADHCTDGNGWHDAEEFAREAIGRMVEAGVVDGE